MKKSLIILTAALSFGFAAAQTAPAAQVPTLTDVPAGHWAKDAIDKIVAKGIILGYPDGTFRGTQNLTRYEAANLRAEFNGIARLEARYRRTGGLQGWERVDLQRRFDILSARIRYERHDRDGRGHGPRGPGPHPGPGYDADRDGHPDRYDRFPHDPRRW